MVELKFDPKAKIVYERVNAGESFFEVARSLGMYTKNAQRLYREYTDDLLKLCAKHSDNSKIMNMVYNSLRRGYIVDYRTGEAKYRVQTIDDLRNTSLEDIAKIPGMGAKSMELVHKMKEDILKGENE